ncbi:AraC family transcriptional regulator [Roseibium sp. SCP14]|uniref:AraC family transcriptional regulator n=1 Tax=Roseibium sp. SCP14 TaxID=3141375 RepID=UPI00333836CD
MTNCDTRSVLPGEFLTAHGTHRYYTHETDDTDRLIDDLIGKMDRLFAFEAAYSEPFYEGFHAHDLGQVTYILSGMVTFATESRSFAVPAGHMIWIPKNQVHSAEALRDVHFVSVYANENELSGLPQLCQVCEASELLKSIFERLISHQIRRDKGPVYDALILLLFHEICSIQSVDLSVRMPQDTRLRRICEEVLRNPSATMCKVALAGVGNVSVRTMTRLFKSELNMTFTEWLHQVLIIAAVQKLGTETNVANIATELGYESPSAFTAMFKRQIGQTPSEFAARLSRKSPQTKSLASARQAPDGLQNSLRD